MNITRILRIGLGYLALVSIQIGVWAVAAPRSFYDNFPGMGRTWVSVDGPYNEHLTRDVGALNLALAALIIAAMIKPTKDMLTVTAIATMAWSIPHFIYHAANTEDLNAGDNVASLFGLAVFVLVGVALLVVARNDAFTSDPEVQEKTLSKLS